MDQEFNLFEYYTLTADKHILLSYKGPVTDIIMAEISQDIRLKFVESPKVSRKLFAIFIELAQNMLFYSAEKIHFGDIHDSVGTILVTEAEDHFTFSCGNLVENHHIQELVESCEQINSMKRDELRDFKRLQRSKPQKERSKGAGIGLIQVALTSETPLVIESVKIDEEFTFFALSVRIDK